MDFFTRLNFASSNEDGRSELAALSGARRILCLTGSGTRPLDLVLSEADTVLAIDINPVQNQLLRLKIAAIAALDHPDLLAYLGILPCADRMALHDRVRPLLPAATDAFWACRRRMIRAGVWYAGSWERVLRFGAKGVRLIRGRAVDALFAAESLAEQADIWQRRFDDRLWRGSIRLLGRRWFWTRVIGEPGGAFLPRPAQVEARLAGAFAHASGTFFFRDSDFASLILRGQNALPSALPEHLLPQNYDRVRAGLNRIRIVDGGLIWLDRLDLGAVDGFSLSDFWSYCDPAAYRACWEGIVSIAAPDAQFCERIFMNAMPIPLPGITVDADLSRRLTQQDRAIIYDIRAGRIGGRQDG